MSDEDREDDPFERLGADADREGDPFEELAGDEDDPDSTAESSGDDVDDVFEQTSSAPNSDVRDVFDGPAESETNSTAAGSEESTAPNPFEQPLGSAETAADSTATGAAESSGSGTSTGTDGPASGAEPESTPTTDPDDPFAGMDEREGDPFEGGESAFERVDVGGVDPDSVWEEITSEDEDESTPDLGDVTGSPDAEVSKHRYCEQCEYFSAPPDVGCSHDEAQILEFVDMETVRLRNCPVVAEQRELDDEQ